MALIPTLTIADSTTFSDEISFSVTDSLTVKAPSQSLSTIIADTTGANNIIIAANADKQTWLFVRHTGTSDGSSSTAAHCDIELTGDVAVGTLKAGEWFFFPFCGNGGSVGVQLQAVGSAVQLEYAYWSDSTAQ
jgi:hypothetical protein